MYNFRTLGGSRHLFGQLWKEYSLSDSRYLTKDPFVLCMESITAVSDLVLQRRGDADLSLNLRYAGAHCPSSSRT